MHNIHTKKTVFVLNVDNYDPDITKITYPLIEGYAKKIGADFHKITERKWPDMPPVYEKFQIYDLAQEMKNDWNIYIDSDAIVHPDTPDFTVLLPKNTVANNANDPANIRFRPNRFTIRDGRNIGCCNWFAVASDQCIDLWHPLEDMTYAEAVENIFPTQFEINSGVIKRDHLIDDYTCTLNVAKYGLKYTTVEKMKEKHMMGGYNFLWHEYTFTHDEKIMRMKQTLKNWGL